MRALFIAALLVTGTAAAPAAAQRAQAFAFPRLAGQVLLASCRQGECVWMRVARHELVRRTPRGELRRITLTTGTAPLEEAARRGPARGIRWDTRQRADYVFCSRARPAVAFPDDDGRSYLIHYLDLFDLAGYQQSSEMLYMRVCHNRSPASTAVLRRLGYRPGARNEQIENARPEDMTRF